MMDDDVSNSSSSHESFSILQIRSSLLVKCIDLCTTMDLIALISNDSVIVYRTLSWEKVLSKSTADLTISGSNPTKLSFNTSGKVLGIGCDNGELGVLGIESMQVVTSFKGDKNVSNNSPIIYLVWQLGGSNANNDIKQALEKTWINGGINAVARAGMEEYFEPGVGESYEIDPIESFFKDAEYNILIALNSDGVLTGHIFGIFPLFTVNLFNQMDMINILIPIQGYSFPISIGIPIENTNNTTAISIDSFILKCDGLVNNQHYYWCEHKATLMLMIQSDLNKLHDMVIGCGKKWKDAGNVIIPKLGLLQSVLDGYQLQMSPVQFMYSIAHCGLWHPAAVASFSQHWNEQGLSRLRSAIDSTSRSIIKLLHLRAIPIATNISLRCREILTSYLSSEDQINDVTHNTYKSLVSFSELLLFKLDETLHEAKQARESMLLYIQFIKGILYLFVYYLFIFIY